MTATATATEMSQMIEINGWLESREFDVFTPSGKPVKEQLESYDKNGTGLGFIFILVPLTSGDDSKISQYDLVSTPVLKIGGQWYTPRDEGFSDVLAGVIRMAGRTEPEPQNE